MASVQSLLEAFERFVGLPWKTGIAGPQKVWFCVYEPRDERRLMAEITNFQIAAEKAKHKWAEFNPNPGLAVVGGHWFAGRGRFLRGEHSRPWYRPVSAAHVVPGWLHGCMGCVPAAFVLSISLIGMRDWAFAALR